ncbi:MAG: hypothetical protein ACRDNE_16890 [Gaiellaceae bacterium]
MNGRGRFCDDACRKKGVRPPAGRPFSAKHPTPSERPCAFCGKPFTPKHPSAAVNGRGRFHSPECRIAGLRKHPQPEERVCPCGTQFTPRPEQVARGDGRYCSPECAEDYLRAAKAEAARAGAIMRNARAEEAAAVHRAAGLLDASGVAELLGVHPSVVSVYRRLGLEPAIELVGELRRPMYRPEDVDRFIRARVRSEDGRALLMFDPDHVTKVWRGHGWLSRFAERRGLTEDEAEAIVRLRVEKRRPLLRHRRGRRRATGPPAHHLEWAEAFARMKVELEEEAREKAALGLPDGPPTDWQVAAAVALHDAEAHPERWEYDPSDPRLERPAADRVLSAVKPLQTAQIQITAT